MVIRAEDAGALGFEPNSVAGLVHEVDDGQVEGIAEVHEANAFLGGRGREPAAVVVGVVREDADRVAVEAGQAADERAAVPLVDLEDGIAVEDGAEDAAGVVDAAALAGDGR
jgi:hypothetical protein